MKIGLFFGSFNPIHVGHLIIANHLLNDTDIEKIWMIVSPQNPLKSGSSLLNEYDRLHLVNVSCHDDGRLKASDIEFTLPRPSYTSDTLAYLTEKFPEHQFLIIMGGDSFQNISKWKNYSYIIKNYPIYVYNRSGFVIENTLNADLYIVEAPLLEISATSIRQLIKEGKSVRYLLTDKVREEIEKSGYYKK